MNKSNIYILLCLFLFIILYGSAYKSKTLEGFDSNYFGIIKRHADADPNNHKECTIQSPLNRGKPRKGNEQNYDDRYEFMFAQPNQPLNCSVIRDGVSDQVKGNVNSWLKNQSQWTNQGQNKDYFAGLTNDQKKSNRHVWFCDCVKDQIDDGNGNIDPNNQCMTDDARRCYNENSDDNRNLKIPDGVNIETHAGRFKEYLKDMAQNEQKEKEDKRKEEDAEKNRQIRRFENIATEVECYVTRKNFDVNSLQCGSDIQEIDSLRTTVTDFLLFIKKQLENTPDNKAIEVANRIKDACQVTYEKGIIGYYETNLINKANSINPEFYETFLECYPYTTRVPISWNFVKNYQFFNYFITFQDENNGKYKTEVLNEFNGVMENIQAGRDIRRQLEERVYGILDRILRDKYLNEAFNEYNTGMRILNSANPTAVSTEVTNAKTALKKYLDERDNPPAPPQPGPVPAPPPPAACL